MILLKSEKKSELNDVMTKHEHPILAAVTAGRQGIQSGDGGPFGCVIVLSGSLVATAWNTVVRNNDPTCHAEMNCIQSACKRLRTLDLSECDLYTTCEPCPMCFGACQWAKIRKIHIGVERFVAAKYGFDDALFYEELGRPAKARSIAAIRRLPAIEGLDFGKLFEQCRSQQTVADQEPKEEQIMGIEEEIAAADDHIPFARTAFEAAQEGVRNCESENRELFAAVIVHEGKIVSKCYNTVYRDCDVTATAEVNAIRLACKTLGTQTLKTCKMYCTAEPDLMSLGAVFWSRLPVIYVGLSQLKAATFGFKDGIEHLKILNNGANSYMTVENIYRDECENLFKEWKESDNAVVY